MLSVLYLCRIVEFATKDDMKTAMKKLQGHEINRKKIKLSVVCYDILISIYTVQFTKVYHFFCCQGESWRVTVTFPIPIKGSTVSMI